MKPPEDNSDIIEEEQGKTAPEEDEKVKPRSEEKGAAVDHDNDEERGKEN